MNGRSSGWTFTTRLREACERRFAGAFAADFAVDTARVFGLVVDEETLFFFAEVDFFVVAMATL